MFRKKSGESDRLPPNEGSFYEAILPAHYKNDSLEQWLSVLSQFVAARWIRWEKREDKWIPVMTKEAPAPEEIVQLLKWSSERTDAHTIDATAGITPTSVLAVTVMIPVKMQVKILIY